MSATIFRAPTSVGPPPAITINPWREYQRQADEWAESIAVEARKNGTSKYLGRIYRTPIADGYAEYIVWRTSPLHLIHLETGDAWHMSAIHARGLRLADVKAEIDMEDSWKKLAEERKARA